MGIGFGPGGAGIAAQAMQNQALEKKKKLDEEAKDRVSKISQLVTAVVMQGGKKGIDPMLNIQTGDPTGDADLDKMVLTARDNLAKLSPYEQELAKKTGYAVAETVGKRFIAEQKRQQQQTTQNLQGIERGRGIEAAGGNPMMQLSGAELSRQMGGMPLGQAEQSLRQYYGGGRNVGRLPFEEPTFGIATGGQPPAQRYVRDATGKYVPVKEGVQGYTKPTQPPKTTQQKIDEQIQIGTGLQKAKKYNSYGALLKAWPEVSQLQPIDKKVIQNMLKQGASQDEIDDFIGKAIEKSGISGDIL